MIKITEITPKLSNELVEFGGLFIDVREHEELEEQAYIVSNIQHIPFSTFDECFHEIPKDAKLILACHSGIRSLIAAQFLVKRGWNNENIYNLEGGIIVWSKNGFPTKLKKRSF